MASIWRSGPKRTRSIGKDRLTVWDGKSFAKLLKVSEEQWINSVAFSPNGKILAVGLGCYNDTRRPDEFVQYQSRPGLVKLYDTSSFKVITSLDQERGVPHVAFSPIGKTLAVAIGIHPCERPGRVQLYDTDTFELKATLTGHRFGISAMDFSPNGEMLATGDAVIGGGPCPGKGDEFKSDRGPGEVRLWSIKDAKQVKAIEAPFGSVLSIQFSPDGQTMAIGGIERAGLIDVETGQQLTTAKFASHSFNSVAFSPDGELLAISSFYAGSRKATEVGLWNVATGKKIASLEDQRSLGGINPMEFSPDGKFLVAAIDSKLRVLSVPSK